MAKGSSMLLTVYAAGPEVFLPHAAEIFRQKAAICHDHGIVMRAPLDDAVDLAAPDASRRIYRQNRAMMLGCDAIIANLTPFRGPSADDGTAFELGFFDALGRPAFAYSNRRAVGRTHAGFSDRLA
jgi:nucleoside 2-deoxyribosyltransferase